MAEALKAMALAGHGVAFLPHSAVEDAVAAGELIRLDRTASRGLAVDRFTLIMEIRLYRDKLATNADDPRQALVRRLWQVVADELGVKSA
jgi:DNA-binding transcriptional LysR family regulator